jgi:hypothetical protein
MPNYTQYNRSIMKPKLPSDLNDLAAMRKRNNPNGAPVGDHTGRCAHCGSNDLWDDNLAYGCNSCDALFGGN